MSAAVAAIPGSVRRRQRRGDGETAAVGNCGSGLKTRHRSSTLEGMTFRKCVPVVLAGAALFLFGCEKPGAPAPAQTPPASNPAALFNPTNAQPKLKTIKLWLGAQEIT